PYNFRCTDDVVGTDDAAPAEGIAPGSCHQPGIAAPDLAPGLAGFSELILIEPSPTEAGARVERRQPSDLRIERRHRGRQPSTEFMRRITQVPRDPQPV